MARKMYDVSLVYPNGDETIRRIPAPLTFSNAGLEDGDGITIVTVVIRDGDVLLVDTGNHVVESVEIFRL